MISSVTTTQNALAPPSPVAREAARLKAQGVVAGVADLFLPYPAREYHGLWIEMKSESGRLTDEQRTFLQVMVSRGYSAHVAHGASAAIDLLKWYLGIEIMQ